MEGLEARDVLSRSRCLSADVNAAFDPTFPDVIEKKNAAYLNRGVVVTKYLSLIHILSSVLPSCDTPGSFSQRLTDVYKRQAVGRGVFC